MNYFLMGYNYTDRDEEIYHKREVERRTLKSIGDEYGLSSERIRGITARVYRKKLIEKEMKSRWLNPKVMSDIQWSSIRVVNCLRNQGAIELPIEDFIKSFNYYRLMRAPNFGKKAMQEICEKLEEHGYKNIEHFRSLKLSNRRDYEKNLAIEAVKKVMTP